MTTSVTATFVFTDLVDSTATAARLGPEAADELRQTHFRLLRDAVAASGGTEVKNLGDGLMVMYSSASRALAGAAGMQQAIERHNRSADEPLGVRIGISAGEAVQEDDDFFGDPVVEAARLCARAKGGQILATELLRGLVGRHATQTFVELGPIELKGLPAPVDAVELVWEPVDAAKGRPPLPPRLASEMSANFVGRAVEVEQLAATWKAITAHDHQRVMLVGGEPGIGKTTLSARFASDAYEQGAAVVYGRCDEDLGVPYQPWIEALTQLVRHAPEPVLTAHVADRGGHLARVVPELSRRLGVQVAAGGDADTERFVLFGCAVDLLARVSGEYPVLVVLDDLHWADRASVQLLRHVAASDEAMRVGILSTFRDSDVTNDHPLADALAAFHRMNRSVRISLRGFDDNDVLQLLETVAGHEMDDQGVALRDALLAETAGNPFFVAEILRHLAETGTIYQQDDGRWVADSDLRAVGLPVSVREVVGRRLAGLGPDTERVLGLGAVIGRDFDIPLLAAVAKTDDDTLIDLCDAAVDAAILQTTDDPDRYTFAHALIEHTLYDGLSPARRARAHKAVAEQLETIAGDDPGDRTAELAYHWAQAVQPTDTAKAVHYAQVAGDRARDQLAPDDAMRWYVQALELLERTADPEPRTRAAILVGLGDAQRQCGASASRETLLEAARLADDIDDVDLLVRAALANTRGWASSIGEGDPEKIAIIDRALERLGDVVSPDRARLLGLKVVEQTYVADFDERLTLAEQALAAARASGDQSALEHVLGTARSAVAAPSTLARRADWSAERLALSDAENDPIERYFTHGGARDIAIESADGEALARHAAVCLEETQRVSYASTHWHQTFSSVVEAVLRGDLDEAERLKDAAFVFGSEHGQDDAIQIFGAQLTNIRDHQGRLDEMVPLVEQALVDTPGLPVYRAVLTRCYAESRQDDDARRLLDEDLEIGFDMRMDNAWTTAHANWAIAAARVKAIDSAAALHDHIRPYHDQIVFTGATVNSSVAYYLGLLDHTLGNLDDADRWFAESVELHDRLRSPLLVAYTNAAWASLLVDRGDEQTRARAMAERALAAAAAGGYGYIERDARAVLDQLP
jgi:class 3 adenylate cyclase/tetratricopeptide (TPR) repeat protein